MRRCVRVVLVGLLLGCTIDEDEEVELGDQAASQLNSQLAIVTDPQVNSYINGLGRAIAARTGRANLKWRFYVVNSPEINAFAVPGGHIYVNRGLIDQTARLSELAGTLGHEIGHVVERHSVKQMEHARNANIGVTIFCTLTSTCDNQLAQAVIAVGGSAYMARYSRLDESQADSSAVVNVIRAGIDPEGIPLLFEKLVQVRARRPGQVEEWFLDHPLEESRINATRQVIAHLLPKNSERLIQDTQDYQIFKARVASLPPEPAPRLPAVPQTNYR
jgi:beta-barrel assembly-enhancing protease